MNLDRKRSFFVFYFNYTIFNSDTSLLTLSSLFPYVPLSLEIEVNSFISSAMLGLNSFPRFTNLSTASTEVFIDRNLSNSVENSGASLYIFDEMDAILSREYTAA